MKWLLRNLHRRASFALRNPRYALLSLLREVSLADERFLASITGCSPYQIRAYLDEPVSTPSFPILFILTWLPARGFIKHSASGTAGADSWGSLSWMVEANPLSSTCVILEPPKGCWELIRA